MKIFTRINNLKFLKNETERQIVMRTGGKNAIEVHKMMSKRLKRHNNIIRKNVLFSKFTQMKYIIIIIFMALLHLAGCVHHFLNSVQQFLFFCSVVWRLRQKKSI